MEVSTQNTMMLHTAVQYVLKAHLKAHWAGVKVAVPYISGKPGGGKSEMFSAECAKLGLGFLPLTVGLIRPEVFSGIPDTKDTIYNGKPEKATEWSVPQIVEKMRECSDQYERVVVLYDDWHMASPEVQASGFETFTYWSINGYEIPRNVAIVLAGNSSALAGARTGFSAVMNRVAKIHVETDYFHWRTWALNSGVDTRIVYFLDNDVKRPYFHGEENAKEPWPSPRSWTELSRALREFYDSDLVESDEATPVFRSIVSAHVGPEASAEYIMWHDIYQNIDARRIFDTGKFTIPKDPIKRYAFVFACTDEFYTRCLRPEKEKKQAMVVFSEIMNQIHDVMAELAIRSIRTLADLNPTIAIEMLSSRHLNSNVCTELNKQAKNLTR